MNNDEKRFKQINRIAKPIQVNPNGDNVNNQQPVNNIPPKQLPKKNKKKVSKETIFIIIIIILSILCLLAFIYLMIISTSKNPQSFLKYKDATTSTTKANEKHFINYELLSESDKIDYESTFNINNFNFTLNASGSTLNINVNGKKITSANYLVNKVGFVDDLVMFSTGSNTTRTTTFYVVDTSGNIIYDIYNYSDIDGIVLTDSNAVNYNPSSIVLSMSRVSNNLIYNGNKIGSNNYANICDEDSLFQNSIEIGKPVRINYSLEYLGDHKFSSPLIIYEESFSDYKANNNLCN